MTASKYQGNNLAHTHKESPLSRTHLPQDGDSESPRWPFSQIQLIQPLQAGWRELFCDFVQRVHVRYLQSPWTSSQCRYFFHTVLNGTDWFQSYSSKLSLRTAWYVKPGLKCDYNYGSVCIPSRPYPSWMADLMGKVMPFCGIIDPDQWPNSCNINLYRDGRSYINWHADDEEIFLDSPQGVVIISLSLGSARRFELRYNSNKSHVVSLYLNNGDIVVMEGATQKYTKHRVPSEQGKIGPRINLTWRWIDLTFTSTAVATSDISHNGSFEQYQSHTTAKGVESRSPEATYDKLLEAVASEDLSKNRLALPLSAIHQSQFISSRLALEELD